MQPVSRPASTSTRPAISPTSRPHQVNTQTKVFDTSHGRLLCIADIRGRLSALNDLAREANASAIIHTGDFGFFEAHSLERINERTLRHLTMYSPLIPTAQRNHLLSNDNPPSVIRSTVTISLLSEFPLLLSGQIKLQVPVFTVWGACEDVNVLEKFRLGTYEIENLHVIDEATTRCIDIGGVKLRLLGLGGALVPHKMFDNGDGKATIAGGQGTMWTTALQIGELVDTAQRVFDPTETRLLVTHASPGREGIINQLGLVLKADLTISAGLHFRYASSYNEFSVQGDFDGLRHKLLIGKEGFDKVWETVKSQVDAVIDEPQRVLLDKAFSVVERIPPQSHATQPGPGQFPGEEPAWKNCWNWNLCDAAYGSLVLDIKDGRVSAELKSQGFNYAYRRTATPSTATAGTPSTAASALPASAGGGPSSRATGTPIASEKPLPPHFATKSTTSTPPPPQSQSVSGRETPRDPRLNGAPNSTAGLDKAEKERLKRERKKERKQQERVEREAAAAKEKEGPGDTAPSGPSASSPTSPAAAEKSEVDVPLQPKSGKATPEVPSGSAPPREDGVTSPATESTGGRTPTSRRPARNPWTIFMRMTVPAGEQEVREFFGEAKVGITRVNYPQNFPGRAQKMVYVEFGDEDAMKAGLEKQGEKLNDAIPELKQATDKESRNAENGGPLRGFGGRGRGGRGAFAARGFAAAGLTRGTPAERGRPSGEDGPKPSEGS
ncbi:Uncharacterized protein SCP_0201160 [Sparassis crispa]|uniref:DUF2433 domain-containing protein n=1 Tax=Sparassis crispa TaxID=139825 RepID=A0A401G9U6_9APHY|nr:Uncharacterized protein SCP_0201160 [Sparassis crispa]GBE78919.1 Uncharacterized protein SCP_0201160 [Sparassis crispa]